MDYILNNKNSDIDLESALLSRIIDYYRKTNLTDVQNLGRGDRT